MNDLKAFVDVLTVYCNDARDVTEIRASEAALKEQVCTLKAQIEVRQGLRLHTIHITSGFTSSSLSGGRHRELIVMIL